MSEIPKWVWIAGGGVLLLLLLSSRGSSGGGTIAQATPDGGAGDTLKASELQAKSGLLSQLVNYAGSLDLANVEAASQAKLADIQKELSLADIASQKDIAEAQAHYAYEATNTAARQQTKQSAWTALGNTALGIATIFGGYRGGSAGSMIGRQAPSPQSLALARPVGGFGTPHFG